MGALNGRNHWIRHVSNKLDTLTGGVEGAALRTLRPNFWWGLEARIPKRSPTLGHTGVAVTNYHMQLDLEDT